MKKIKIAMFSSTSVHASAYAMALPFHEDYEWVAASIAPQDQYINYYDNIAAHTKIYDSDEELLAAHPDLDAVILAGANEQTYSQFKLLVKHGIKNVLVMKVPSFFMEEYEDMQRLAKENDMVVQVELEMRYEQTVRHLKQLIDEGAIGKLLSIEITNTTVVVPPEVLDWVTDPKRSYGRLVPLKEGDDRFRGGCLTDHPHAFDLCRYFTDSEFDSVYADVSPAIRGRFKIEESAFIVGKMKNGVTINIDPSYSRHENALPAIESTGHGWEGYPKRVEVFVNLHGEKGSILSDCFHSGVFYLGLPYHTYAHEYVGGGNSRHYTPALDAFAKCIRERTTPLTNLDMHKNTMKAVTACYESIATGKPVKL